MSKTENEATTPDAATGHAGGAALSPEQIEDLKTRAAKADENWDRLLRTTADFDNFKKRAAREKIDSAHYASASLIQKLLPVGGSHGGIIPFGGRSGVAIWHGKCGFLR